MQPQTRVGDNSLVPSDTHGQMDCPHKCVGPGVLGSEDVIVNNHEALRKFDMGVHAACCGSNLWIAVEGSETVLINMRPTHRRFDRDMHCGGDGYMIEGSDDVFVGDGTESGMSKAKAAGKSLVQMCGGK
jgi:uncharacterized Zn-binding protein involved in type VI secretion